MASKPTIPCALCGKMLWPVKGSYPPGKRRCRQCRWADHPSRLGSYKTYRCAWSECGVEFTRYVRPDRVDLPERCCSKSCMMKRRAQLDGSAMTIDERRAKWRQKNHKRRAARRIYDVTPAYELELRAKAKRCPLCDVRFIDGPYKPASKELDHIVPINVGGTHTVGNVRVICRRCNQERPKDGLDFAGQPTLWSADHDVIPRRRAMRTPCECGAQRERSEAGNYLKRCRDCRIAVRELVEQRRVPAGVPRTITCPYCKVTLTVTRIKQKTCGSKACQKRSRLDSW